jgi:hypothetical protein
VDRTDVGHAKADVADEKVVQMGILPPEVDLNSFVQRAERRVGGDAHAAPDGGLDVAKRDGELKDVTERGG